MFTFLHAIILGIVEGITEFLPVSSTGHLILSATFLNIVKTNFFKSFEIAIQLGAIFAVVVIYGKKIFTDYALDKKIITAFIPTAIIGFILYKFIKGFLLGNDWVVVGALFIGGVVLIFFELYLNKFKQKNTSEKLEPSKIAPITYRDAFIIGLAQSLAVIPGVSRSAATIVGGLVLGYSREKIVEFSFLLAIPTMAAATGYDLLKTGFSISANEYVLLAVGFFVSFVTAWFTVKWLLKFVKNHTFIGFGVYRIIVALVSIIFII